VAARHWGLSGGLARRWLLGAGWHDAGGSVAAQCGDRGWGLGAAAQDGRATGGWSAGCRGRAVGRQPVGRSGLRRWAGRDHTGCRPAGGSNPSRRLARAEGGESSERVKA
jgi:hypothetical protein